MTTDFVLDETFTRLFVRCPFGVARRFGDAILESESSGLLSIERIALSR